MTRAERKKNNNSKRCEYFFFFGKWKRLNDNDYIISLSKWYLCFCILQWISLCRSSVFFIIAAAAALFQSNSKEMP